MEHKEVTLEKLTIVGISTRTTNKNQQSLDDIGKLWNTFFRNNILQQIPSKISDDIYCLYTDYESDHTGEYTTIIGCVVSNIDNAPIDLIIKEIPACTYNKYISEGEIHQAVGKTWTYIWQSKIDRKYLADFDIYGKDAKDPSNARVTTYLSIK